MQDANPEEKTTSVFFGLPLLGVFPLRLVTRSWPTRCQQQPPPRKRRAEAVLSVQDVARELDVGFGARGLAEGPLRGASGDSRDAARRVRGTRQPLLAS